MNSLYLYLHRCLIIRGGDIMDLKKALFIVSNYLSTIPKSLRMDVLKDMEKLRLVKFINGRSIQILNKGWSECMVERVNVKPKLEKDWWT